MLIYRFSPWFLLLSCLLATGCGNPDRARLVGTWNMQQPDSLMGRLNHETGETESENAAVDRDDFNQTPKMQIEFRGNGGLATITRMGRVDPKPKQGSWQMVSYDSATNQMQIKCTLGLQQTEHEVTFLDANTIKLIPPNMAGTNVRITFSRQE